MIEVHHLCKHYGNQKAVDDISFTSEKGHLVADDTPENLEKLFAGNTTIELTARAEDGEIREMLSFVSGIRTISCSAPPRPANPPEVARASRMDRFTLMPPYSAADLLKPTAFNS